MRSFRFGGRPKEEMVTPEEFLAAWWASNCSPSQTAKTLQITERNVYFWRAKLQALGHQLESVPINPGYVRAKWFYPRQVDLQFAGETVLVGSDAHIWPGELTPAMVAFAEVARAVKPAAIVLNGDIIDGARVSRHARSPGWTPSLQEELTAVRDWLGTLPTKPKRYWAIGNHDARVDSYLATHAPELEDYAGSLRDRFTDWMFAWQFIVNNAVVIRHRFRKGVHAAYNNALHSGKSMVTGDTHQLEVRSITDMNGTRYGVETGCLGDPHGPQFQYAEAMPSRARQGFVLLTFAADGTLLAPEWAEVQGGQIWFRGRTWANKTAA